MHLLFRATVPASCTLLLTILFAASCGSKGSLSGDIASPKDGTGSGQSGDGSVKAQPTPIVTQPVAVPTTTVTLAPPLPTVTPTSNPIEANFTSIQEKILKTKCVACHSGTSPALNIDLSSYENIINSVAFPPLVVRGEPLKSNLVKVVESGKMPYGPNKLSDAEKAVLKTWIANGARKNETDPLPTPTPVPTEPGGD